MRIHHYLPGIGTVLITGGAAILMRTDGDEPLFGIPFGVGAGLTLDEVGMLAELDNPYWNGELLSIIQAGIAATTAGALALGFYRRGATLGDSQDEHEAPGAGSGGVRTAHRASPGVTANKSLD